MEDLLSNISEYVGLATSIVGVFAILATTTANKTDNKIVDMLLKLINFVAMNFGEASNQEPQKFSGEGDKPGRPPIGP